MAAFDDMDAEACAAIMDVFGGVPVVITPRSTGGGYTARAQDPDRDPVSVEGIFTEGTAFPKAVSAARDGSARLSGPQATVWLPPDQVGLLPYRPKDGDLTAVSGRQWAIARVSGTDRADMLLTLTEETPL